jgi:hypothetical protein
MIGVAPSQLSRIEHGETQNIMGQVVDLVMASHEYAGAA